MGVAETGDEEFAVSALGWIEKTVHLVAFAVDVLVVVEELLDHETHPLWPPLCAWGCRRTVVAAPLRRFRSCYC